MDDAQKEKVIASEDGSKERLSFSSTLIHLDRRSDCPIKRSPLRCYHKNERLKNKICIKVRGADSKQLVCGLTDQTPLHFSTNLNIHSETGFLTVTEALLVPQGILKHIHPPNCL